MIPEQKAWELVWRHRGFWFLHFAISLVLAGLIVGWFWIPESSAVSVATSLAGAILLAVFALVWIGATLVYYRQPTVRAALSAASRHLPALVVWGALGALLVWASAARVPWWASWIVIPAILAPVGWSVTANGFAGFAPRKWPLKSLRAYPVIAIAGVLLPFLLIQWHPELPGIVLQSISLAIRWALAAAAAVTAWLFLAALLATQAEAPAATS